MSTSVGSPVPSQSPRPGGGRRMSTRAPSSPGSSAASGQRDRSRRTGLAAPAVVGGDGEARPLVVRGDEAPVGVGAHEGLVGEADADRAGVGRARGRPARRCSSTRCRAATDGPGPPRRRPGRDARRCDRLARPRGGPGRGRSPRAASSAQATRGRPSSTVSGLGMSVSKREPRPAARTPPRRSWCRRVPAQACASVSARRTSTRARCSRYSGEALRSPGASVPSAACCGRVGDRRAVGERGLDRPGPQRRGAHVHQARRGWPRWRDRDRADDRPVLGSAVELLVREPVGAGLRARGSR